MNQHREVGEPRWMLYLSTLPRKVIHGIDTVAEALPAAYHHALIVRLQVIQVIAFLSGYFHRHWIAHIRASAIQGL